MIWTGFQIAARIRSPLHIGLRQSGNLMQTRRFVPGRTLWGALAARLARDEFAGNYALAGRWVDENLRFSYFYPSLAPPAPVKPEDEWSLLYGYVSTALENGRSKLDQSLHEVEYIGPHDRRGNPVWLVGYLWCKRAERLANEKAIRALFARLALGGERRYGWGLIGELVVTPLPLSSPVFESWDWGEEGGRLIVRPRPGVNECRLFAHITVDNPPEDGIFSDFRLEPWVGRETPTTGTEAHFGRMLSPFQAVIAPGANVVSLKRNTLRLNLAARGLLQFIKEPFTQG